MAASMNSAIVDAKTEELKEGVPLETLKMLSNQWSSVGVSTVVLGLLAVPIVVLTTVALIVRARNSNRRLRLKNLTNGFDGRKSKSKHDNGLNLGSLLNSRNGFQKLATEDNDALDSADSDVEEFSQMATRV